MEKATIKKNGEQKSPQIPRTKPQFKAEKLSESDAKRILQQLQDQEKKSQQRILRGKSEKAKEEGGKERQNGKDW